MLFSGGKDSCLASLRLTNQGYKVKLLTFDNGCMLEINNTRVTAEKLMRSNKNIIEHTIESSSKEFQLLRELFINLRPTELSSIGESTFSQLNCLTCRTSMYIKAISIAKSLGIEYIAEGARRIQLFAIELDDMLNEYRKLCEEHNISLLLPVHEVVDDWGMKNEMLEYNFVPKVYEGMCLLGTPLSEPLSDDIINGVLNFYKKLIYPVAQSYLSNNK